VKRTILLSVLLSLSATSTAAVYQCTGDNDQTIFSDQPCGDDAVKLDHKAAPALGGPMVTEGSRDFLEGREVKSAVHRIDTNIRQLQLQLKRAKRQLDVDMAEWESDKSRANNNLAGATWENSLAQEASLKQQQYQSKVSQIDRDMDRLREDRRRLLEQ
jgi:hypothetical protein